jgi:hypothetical protein
VSPQRVPQPQEFQDVIDYLNGIEGLEKPYDRNILAQKNFTVALLSKGLTLKVNGFLEKGTTKNVNYSFIMKYNSVFKQGSEGSRIAKENIERAASNGEALRAYIAEKAKFAVGKK